MPESTTIIVVEDEMGVRITLCGILEDAGYKVIGAERGTEALEVIRGNQFEVIIADIRLPDVSGMEILELAKEINPDAAVIMITGYASVETAVDAVNQGAYAYFVKPINPDELKTTIANALRQQRLLQENKGLVENLQRANKLLFEANEELRIEITERKRMETERRELEQKAQVASRLASIGEMASGICHEVNNPLTPVIGFAHLLLEKDIPEDIRKDIEVIHRGAQRVADIINRLLTFARQQKPEQTYVNINDIIENALAMTAYELETSNVTATTQLDTNLPWIIADAGQLQHVFHNLIINAKTEMKLAHGRGKLFIKTEVINNIMRISLKDDGPGIAKENLEKIFDPFFTTRKPGEGAGLGLSVCHGTVTEHNGRIYADSELGRGATFTVELPVVSETQQPAVAELVTNKSYKGK